MLPSDCALSDDDDFRVIGAAVAAFNDPFVADVADVASVDFTSDE